MLKNRIVANSNFIYTEIPRCFIMQLFFFSLILWQSFTIFVMTLAKMWAGQRPVTRVTHSFLKVSVACDAHKSSFSFSSFSLCPVNDTRHYVISPKRLCFLKTQPEIGSYQPETGKLQFNVHFERLKYIRNLFSVRNSLDAPRRRFARQVVEYFFFSDPSRSLSWVAFLKRKFL